jgi:hypothetical protein
LVGPVGAGNRSHPRPSFLSATDGSGPPVSPFPLPPASRVAMAQPPPAPTILATWEHLRAPDSI